MDTKAQRGLFESPSFKRYRSFLNTVADQGIVWLINSKEGLLTYEFHNSILIPVWANKSFCESMCNPCEKPIQMEVHEFSDWARALNGNIFFAVAPNEEDFISVASGKLINEIASHLSEVE